MRIASLLLVCLMTAVAQPQQDPLDAVLRDAWQANGDRQLSTFAALRDRARKLLEASPATVSTFPSHAQQVAQLYQNGGLNAQARAILQESLARVAGLDPANSSRLTLLYSLAEAYERDGNLLKALAYREQIAALPPASAQVPQSRLGFVSIPRVSSARFMSGPILAGGTGNTYILLANLYQRLGRPEQAVATAEKIRTVANADLMALAQFYEQRGQFTEASAIYQQMADQAANPQNKSGALQMQTNLLLRQERFSEAAATLRQAIAAVESPASGDGPSQTLWMHQQLANLLRQAGQIEDGDKEYGRLLQQVKGGPQDEGLVTGYAQYLADSGRGAQAEETLKQYLTTHSELPANQKTGVWYNLANLVHRHGDEKAAEEYRQLAQSATSSPRASGENLVAPELEKAEVALNQRKFHEAFTRAARAVEMALHSPDGMNADWRVPNIAAQLAAAEETGKAEELYRRLFGVLQGDPTATAQRLIPVWRSYAAFLMNQKGRTDEVYAAIEQMRRLTLETAGPETAAMCEPLRLQLDFETGHAHHAQAQSTARQLLEMQESLSGTTSQEYGRDLETAARAYENAGDLETALRLRRLAITAMDRSSLQMQNWERADSRMRAARTLIRLERFEDAIALAEQAEAIAAVPPGTRRSVTQELEQFRQMKQQALARSTRK